MQLTEWEMTAALHGAAKTVLASQRRDIRKGKVDVEDAWQEMTRYQRFKILDSLGDQLLPVLRDLPEVEVEPGRRPTFTTSEITAAVEANLGETEGKLRRKVTVAARVALVREALGHLPPRGPQDTLDVPDHL